VFARSCRAADLSSCVAILWIPSVPTLRHNVSGMTFYAHRFGYRPEDLFGSYISSLMPEHKRLDE
jgi:hypothetical protein